MKKKRAENKMQEERKKQKEKKPFFAKTIPNTEGYKKSDPKETKMVLKRLGKYL